ncbi:hypothetical protein GGQ73_000479 [Rhizobium skierniewicense]|uniref:Uncharacterized protein n=1 Tax=Rhizobium skierniewicense TaxID=984260 RepID=A0A7W6G1I4_9HYPH|nr:hypothetical protein [Rhizobium skierniewicense]MBB3944556.1 hypothetical protein [Rhizobium skierniewicense]NTF33519.1 hypothetical protein [Rhizobium skierniewicense]
MAQAVILGIEGEEGLWLVDFQSGTITAVKEPLTGELEKAASLRASGVAITKGVNFAISASADTLGAGGIHEDNG